MTRTRTTAFLVSCEHGGSRVPPGYRHLFAGAEAALTSHRGWDPGAASLARELARRLGAPLHLSTVTRLLVDLNRSPHHPRVFSQWTRSLDRTGRAGLLASHHTPHRQQLAEAVGDVVAGGGRVVHLGVHTFTPVLDGVVRRADVALLYDPARPGERALCAGWAAALARRLPALAVRRNQPYRGATDGLPTWLRGLYPDAGYLGIEIEVNQRLLGASRRFPASIGRALLASLSDARGWEARGS